MKKRYEILFTDKHTETVDRETMEEIVDELEMCDRWDVSQIHELKRDGSLGKTLWTEEEGLLVLL
jgi:hypothetical protein